MIILNKRIPTKYFALVLFAPPILYILYILLSEVFAYKGMCRPFCGFATDNCDPTSCSMFHFLEINFLVDLIYIAFVILPFYTIFFVIPILVIILIFKIISKLSRKYQTYPYIEKNNFIEK